jgi:hypothetical protein
MSALPPEADMLIVGINVCSVPKADFENSIPPRRPKAVGPIPGLLGKRKARQRRGLTGLSGRGTTLWVYVPLTPRAGCAATTRMLPRFQRSQLGIGIGTGLATPPPP